MKNSKMVLLALAVLILVYLAWPKKSNYYNWNRYGMRMSIPDGYFNFMRMDMSGNDILEMDGTRFECATTCDTTAGCAGFVRSPSMNHCWLKSKDGRKRRATDRNSYVKTSPPS